MFLKPLTVIPSYNNPATICAVMEDCLKSLSSDILILDDGSDKPAETLIRAKHNGIPGRVVIRRHVENLGKGAALKSSFAYALRHGYTHVICVDGDGQHLGCEAR